jgi:hypothetical protein
VFRIFPYKTDSRNVTSFKEFQWKTNRQTNREIDWQASRQADTESISGFCNKLSDCLEI